MSPGLFEMLVLKIERRRKSRFFVLVNERLNSEVSEKKGCGGMYIPPHPFFSGVHPTLDHYKNLVF